VTFYTKENCNLCDLAREMIRDLREDPSIELETVDITKSPDAWEEYHEKMPVIEVGEEILWGRIDEGGLRGFLFGEMRKKMGNILHDQLERSPARELCCARKDNNI